MDNNNLDSIQKLFNDRIFRIPDYQRGYSWNEQQLIDFWEDILNIPIDREHYTGMISLKEVKDISNIEKWNDIQWLVNNRGYKVYHIVDGQQRLTTIIILINQIIKFVSGLPENVEKSDEEINLNDCTLKMIKENYLVISKPNSDDILKSFKFGYEVDNPSYKYFKSKILESEIYGEVDETFYTLNLQRARDFFDKSIKDLYESNGSNVEVLNRLFKNLTQKLKFNTYFIEDDFNVYIAFETMNNRGKPLSNLELLKNRLIYLTTLFKDDNDTKNEVREDINDTWREIYEFLGKNKTKPLNDDEFLQAHWIIYFGYSRKTNESYSNFLLKNYFTQKRVIDDYSIFENTQNIDDDYDLSDDEQGLDDEEEVIEDDKKLTLKDISKYVKSLKSIIPYWYYLNFPEQSTFNEDIKIWLEKLNRIGYAYFKPLTCVVLSKDDISDTDKLKCLKSIERWIFLLFRLSGYFETYKNSSFYNKAYSLYNGKESITNIISELNAIAVLNSNGEISIDAPLSKLSRLFKNSNGYYSWNTIRYFLYEYELFLKGKTGTDIKLTPNAIFKKDDKDKISVEHIYPQTGDNLYWLKRFGMYTDDSIHNIANSLGNLLPLSLSINSSFQNDSFPDKKDGTNKRERCYKNGCYSEMEVWNYTDWNIEAIKERGIKMLNFMANRYSFIFTSEEDRDKLLFLSDIKIDEVKENQILTGQYDVTENEKEYNKSQKERQIFWTLFNEMVEKRGMPFNTRKASTDHWYIVAMGTVGIHISITLVNSKSRIGISAHIANNKELFDKLLSKKEIIESELGFNLEWKSLEDNNASDIIYYIDGLNFDDHSNYEDLMNETIDRAVLMRDVFKKYV
ncbi:DUF4268 domain-containing protein [bacterium]|nr:DUF4268 domain-containing protein [bacterium]